jgi:hypothetical protein
MAVLIAVAAAISVLVSKTGGGPPLRYASMRDGEARAQHHADPQRQRARAGLMRIG